MNPLETIKTHLDERREQALTEEIRQAAGQIAVGLIDSLGSDEIGPYSFEVGKSPKGITTEEYLDKINVRVRQMLGRFSRFEEVMYDPEASKVKSHRADNLPATIQGGHRQPRDSLVMVYR